MPTTYTPGEMVDHYEIIRMLGQGGMNQYIMPYARMDVQQTLLKLASICYTLFYR